MASHRFHIVGISGSLRRASFNSGLLRAAKAVAPADVDLEIADLSDVPLYNGDVEAVGLPESVQRLKAQIVAADAVLLAVPEYNYSFSGVIKNAIDWASRPTRDSAWAGKPVALMGASAGMFGSFRAQLALRQSLINLDVLLMSRPELYVPGASTKFDAAGDLIDDDIRQRLTGHVAALVAWARRVNP